MKKLSLLLVFVFALGLTTTSCRETEEEKMEQMSDDIEDMADDVEDEAEEMMGDDDASDPVENTVQEGVNEVQENTGLGGEDDM